MLTGGPARTIAEVANETGIHVADVSRILPLASWRLDHRNILCGRQPVELTDRTLMRDDLPHRWSDQLQRFGI